MAVDGSLSYEETYKQWLQARYGDWAIQDPQPTYRYQNFAGVESMRNWLRGSLDWPLITVFFSRRSDQVLVVFADGGDPLSAVVRVHSVSDVKELLTALSVRTSQFLLHGLSAYPPNVLVPFSQLTQPEPTVEREISFHD